MVCFFTKKFIINTMQVNLKQLRSLSIWTCALLIIGWLAFVGFIVFLYESFGLNKKGVEDIQLVLLIVFTIFLLIGFITSVFISNILSRKSKYSYLNVIPVFLCIPAIVSCTKYIREWKNGDDQKLSNNEGPLPVVHEKQIIENKEITNNKSPRSSDDIIVRDIDIGTGLK